MFMFRFFMANWTFCKKKMKRKKKLGKISNLQKMKENKNYRISAQHHIQNVYDD